MKFHIPRRHNKTFHFQLGLLFFLTYRNPKINQLTVRKIRNKDTHINKLVLQSKKYIFIFRFAFQLHTNTF